MENPLLTSSHELYIMDELTNERITLTKVNISKYYKYVYLLVKKDNTPISDDFYSWSLSKDLYDNVTNNLLIQRVSIDILQNDVHFNSILVLSNEQLQKYNIFNYDLSNKNLVVPILNITYQNLLPYIQQFESFSCLQKIYNSQILTKYLKSDTSTFKYDQYICSLFDSIDDSNYWCDPKNCLLNLTKKFNERKFSFQTNRLVAKDVATIINDMLSKLEIKKNKKGNYLKDISKNNRFIDISSVTYYENQKLYSITENNEFTKEDINSLFDTLDRKQKFLLFCNMMVSKSYSHLVINNQHILHIMRDDLNRFNSLFRYLLGYTWLQFYAEECIKRSYVKTTDNFIFDINTASKLPIYPFYHSNPKSNPYAPILVSDTVLKASENLCSIPDFSVSNKDICNYGICNLTDFKEKFNIFCTGSPLNNLFEDFNFVKNKCAITGSIMTACIQKKNPLLSRFIKNTKDALLQFYNYVNEYYAKADIDIIFCAKNSIEFIDNVKELYNTIIINICKFNKYAEPTHTKLKLNKTINVFISEEFLKTEHNMTCELIKTKIESNDESIKQLLKPQIDKLIVEKTGELMKDHDFKESDYPDIYSNDYTLNLYLNKKDNFHTIDIDIAYKYTIESPYLSHKLELFPTKYDDFFGIVSSFHLPCVRAYYDGSNVYMTPSCISAHMTYMNLDYKYVSGSKDIIDIINKYRARGFGTWLSQQEKLYFSEYSKVAPFWKNLYANDTTNKNNKTLFGTLSLNHRLFRPRLYNIDQYIDIDPIETYERYNNADTALPLTETIYNDNINSELTLRYNYIHMPELFFNKYKTIDENGFIVPLKKWLINYTWSLYESEYKEVDSDNNEIKKMNNIMKSIKINKIYH